MPFLRRRPAVPSEVAAALELGSSRVLAWSPLVGGGAAVATLDTLRILTPRGQAVVRPWVDVDHAAWDNESGMLVVWWVGTRRTTPLEVTDATRLPEVIRERVQASVVLSATVVLADGKQARVALRRDGTGALTAQSLLPPRVREDDPEVAALLAEATAALWAEAGEANLTADQRPPSL